MNHLLQIENLKKNYKDFSLNIASLDIPKGSIMGIIGPNGAGKTTTIKILMNMVKPDSGTVRIFGLNPEKQEKIIKNRVGYVGEEHFFYENKTVEWTGKFVSAFFEEWDQNIFQKRLTDFKISRTKKAQDLSKGMRVKLSLAIALSHNPELIILDEPTAGLDPVIRRDVLEILRAIPEKGKKSVVISSHITDDIERIADYVTFIVDGKILLSSEKDELLARWKKIHYKKGALENHIRNTLLLHREHEFGDSGITDRFPEIKKDLEQKIAKDDVKVENISLDDILISFVKGDGSCGNS